MVCPWRLIELVGFWNSLGDIRTLNGYSAEGLIKLWNSPLAVSIGTVAEVSSYPAVVAEIFLGVQGNLRHLK